MNRIRTGDIVQVRDKRYQPGEVTRVYWTPNGTELYMRAPSGAEVGPFQARNFMWIKKGPNNRRARTRNAVD